MYVFMCVCVFVCLMLCGPPCCFVLFVPSATGVACHLLSCCVVWCMLDLVGVAYVVLMIALCLCRGSFCLCSVLYVSVFVCVSIICFCIVYMFVCVVFVVSVFLFVIVSPHVFVFVVCGVCCCMLCLSWLFFPCGLCCVFWVVNICVCIFCVVF